MKRLFLLIGLALLVGCGQGDEPEVESNIIEVGGKTAVSPPVIETETETAVSPTTEPTLQPIEEQEEPTTMPADSDSANADVTFVKATETSAGVWTFAVSVDHPDTGWEDYADGWDVFLPDGTVLKLGEDSPFTRLLLHPHVGERPFTRSQSNIQIPLEISQVHIRAHDLVDGFGGQEVIVDLAASSDASELFEVIRLP